MLVIACLAIVGSFALRIHSDDQVAVIGTSELILPPLCLSRAWFGISCPGCGLTRSFICLASGHWRASWEMHRLGWLLAILVLMQIPYRIHGLCYPHKALLSRRLRNGIAQLLIGLLIVNWLIGLLLDSQLPGQ
jgi:hypothetical protein